jgi:hypothetical protein
LTVQEFAMSALFIAKQKASESLNNEQVTSVGISQALATECIGNQVHSLLSVARTSLSTLRRVNGKVWIA